LRHVARFHPEAVSGAIYKCTKCNYVTKYEESLTKHLHKHATVKHMCDFCGKVGVIYGNFQ